MTKRLTTPQMAVFRLVADGKVRMFCDKCVWHYRDDQGDAINRRTMEALKAANLIDMMYFRDGACVSLTIVGRERLAQWNRNRRAAA